MHPAPNSTKPSLRPTGVVTNSSSPASTALADPRCTWSPSALPSKNAASVCACLSKASTPPQQKAEPCSGCPPSWQKCNENSSSPTPATGLTPRGPEGEKVAESPNSHPSTPSAPSAPKNFTTPATTPSNRSRTYSRRNDQPSTDTSTKKASAENRSLRNDFKHKRTFLSITTQTPIMSAEADPVAGQRWNQSNSKESLA